MNVEHVEKIADVALFEGFRLNPYRSFGGEDRPRFNFGVLYPSPSWENGADNSQLQTECLLTGNAATPVEFKIRFLQLAGIAGSHEAVERTILAPACGLYSLQVKPFRQKFEFEDAGTPEAKGATVRGEFELKALEVTRGLFKITLTVWNRSEFGSVDKTDPNEVWLRSLVSTHCILHATGGRFISVIAPPAHLKLAAESCNNVGLWPVLAGEKNQTETVLAAPIIMYDYPRLARSAPALFEPADTVRISKTTGGEQMEL